MPEDPKTLSPYSPLMTSGKVNETHLLVHVMKVYRGEELRLNSFLTLTLDGGKRPALYNGQFTPEESFRVGHRAGMEVLEKGKILCPVGAGNQSLHRLRFPVSTWLKMEMWADSDGITSKLKPYRLIYFINEEFFWKYCRYLKVTPCILR